ncbi:unnamed protein product [Linum tenue]|uniref:Uncharacterized protein n=1 Tax=Linum tenue TaxID=586396 RepID=A0AAV0JQ59_9ROSI|nr:unnamed protein product [Linum tenue]
MDFPPPPLYPAPSPTFEPVPVAQHELKTFHQVDRRLYSRLVFDLDRDPEQSMRVMALWLFFERPKYVLSMVQFVLTFNDFLIQALADETMLCLKCLDYEHYSPFVVHSIYEIPLLYNISENRITLAYFRENRVAILRGVAQLIADVCIRAFDDQLAMSCCSRAFAFTMQQQQLQQQMHHGWDYYRPEVSEQLWTLNAHHVYDAAGGSSRLQEAGTSVMEELKGEASGGYLALLLSPYDNAASSSSSTRVDEINAGMNNLEICRGNVTEGNSDGVPADERTVLLTFSKGYPVSKREVRDFFSMTYGDIYEDVHMQEVMTAAEQPLYAKLVLKVQGMIEVVLNGKRKAKFSINGKHVCARKYVKKSGTPS